MPLLRMNLSRRSLLRSTGAALAAPALSVLGLSSFAPVARADDKTWKHGLSLFGDVKYPAGFKHIDYVKADAPQGGTVRMSGFGTFDNFNEVVALVKGNLAMGTNFINESLMTQSFDEVSIVFCFFV